MATKNTAVDMAYIKQMLVVYGFTKAFVAKELDIKISSLERRIERAKRNGEW